MKPRMVEVSEYDGKNWVPSGTAVFHGFFSDYEEFHEGPGNYPAALIEWEDGRVESVVARSIRFLEPTLKLDESWLSKEMQTPPKGFKAVEGSWKPRLGDYVKWPGSRRTCVVMSVNAGPTKSWTLIKERKGSRRDYVVQEVSELVPCDLEEDEE